MKWKVVSIAVLFTIVGLGCGGGQDKTLKDRILEEEDDGSSLVDAVVGDVAAEPIEEDETEQPSDAVGEAPTAPVGDTIEGNQGALVITMKIPFEGKQVSGYYNVKTASESPEIVKEKVPTGEEVRLDPGTYDIELFTDDVVGYGKQDMRDVEIPRGRRITRPITLKVGELTLINGAGKGCRKAALKIKRKGATDWIPGKFKTCVPMLLPSGDYEAKMGHVPISGIKVYDGGIQKVPIRKK
jgi:hypothetical protein